MAASYGGIIDVSTRRCGCVYEETRAAVEDTTLNFLCGLVRMEVGSSLGLIDRPHTSQVPRSSMSRTRDKLEAIAVRETYME